MEKREITLNDIEKVLKEKSWWTILVTPFATRLTLLVIRYTRLTPNQITLGSFILSMGAGVAFLFHHWILGALLSGYCRWSPCPGNRSNLPPRGSLWFGNRLAQNPSGGNCPLLGRVYLFGADTDSPLPQLRNKPLQRLPLLPKEGECNCPIEPKKGEFNWTLSCLYEGEKLGNSSRYCGGRGSPLLFLSPFPPPNLSHFGDSSSPIPIPVEIGGGLEKDNQITLFLLFFPPEKGREKPIFWKISPSPPLLSHHLMIFFQILVSFFKREFKKENSKIGGENSSSFFYPFFHNLNRNWKLSFWWKRINWRYSGWSPLTLWGWICAD